MALNEQALACVHIHTLPRVNLHHFESSQAFDLDLSVLIQSCLYDIYQAGNKLLSRLTVNLMFLGQNIGQVISIDFIHCRPLLSLFYLLWKSWV